MNFLSLRNNLFCIVTKLIIKKMKDDMVSHNNI